MLIVDAGPSKHHHHQHPHHHQQSQPLQAPVVTNLVRIRNSTLGKSAPSLSVNMVRYKQFLGFVLVW